MSIKVVFLKPRRKRYTNEQIIQAIVEWAEENGKSPTIKDFRNAPYLPDPKHVQRKLGKKWNDILKELGLKPNLEYANVDNITDEGMLGLLREELVRLNTTSHYKFEENKTKNIPSYKSYMRRFNKTWNEVVSMVGLEYRKTPDQVSETNEELLEMYIDFSNRIGRPASKGDLDGSDEIYGSGVFTTRFGSMQELKRLAGFPVIKTNSRRYTREGLMGMLLNEYAKSGRRLTISEIKADKNLPAITTFLKYFRTTKMEIVWEAVEKESGKYKGKMSQKSG